MRISQWHSHLGGYEWLQCHKPQIWQEIVDLLQSNLPLEGMRKMGTLTTAEAIQRYIRLLEDTFTQSGWLLVDCIAESGSVRRKRDTTSMTKDRINMELMLGVEASVVFERFAKHLAFYVRDEIDLGIEILPMKELQEQMSSGVGYYEGALYDLARQGRGVPSVPLLLLGVAP